MNFQYVVIISLWTNTKDILCQVGTKHFAGVNNYGENNPAFKLFRNLFRWEMGVAFHLNMLEFQVPSLDESGYVGFEAKLLFFLIRKYVFAF